MPIKVIKYKCKSCLFENKKEKIVNKHEQTCMYNPENEPCFSCVHHADEYAFCKAFMKWIDEIPKSCSGYARLKELKND